RGWVPSARLAGHPGDTPLDQVRADVVGHTFTVGTDSLRAALDAAVLSPAGQAVGVDGGGSVVGVVTLGPLPAAIQAADKADGREDAGGKEHSPGWGPGSPATAR